MAEQENLVTETADKDEGQEGDVALPEAEQAENANGAAEESDQQERVEVSESTPAEASESDQHEAAMAEQQETGTGPDTAVVSESDPAEASESDQHEAAMAEQQETGAGPDTAVVSESGPAEASESDQHEAAMAEQQETGAGPDTAVVSESDPAEASESDQHEAVAEPSRAENGETHQQPDMDNLPEAEQEATADETQNDLKPTLKTGLTENLQDMGIDSAEDTNDEPMPMETNARDEENRASQDEEMRAKPEDGGEMEEEEVEQENEEKQVTEDLEKENKDTSEPSADQSESANKDNVTDDDKLHETKLSTKDNNDSGAKDSSAGKSKDLRRSRSKETDSDEKGKLDEQQSERSAAKKPKRDADAQSQPTRRTLRSTRPDLSKMKTLEDFGYEFNEDGEMKQIKTGSSFVFEVVPGDRSFNQKHYEALGEIITEHVFQLMETECNLQKAYVPVDSSEKQPRTFIFVSDHVLPVIHGEEPPSDKKLLVLIHGSGVVRAGQWARRLIINNNLSMGTMIPYIKQAMEEDYEVMLLNTNYNSDRGRPIPGNSSPEAHGKYVWKHFISEWPGKVAIVAHSAGGYVTVEMAKQCDTFMEKVFAVGFTDSVHSLGYYTSSDVSDWFIKRSKNWVSSSKPLDTPLGSYGGDCPRVSAGSPKHEETSYYSMESIFEYFKEMEKEDIDEITKQEAQRAYSEPDVEEQEPEKKREAQEPSGQKISRGEREEPEDTKDQPKKPWWHFEWLFQLISRGTLLGVTGAVGSGLLAVCIWWYMSRHGNQGAGHVVTNATAALNETANITAALNETANITESEL